MKKSRSTEDKLISIASTAEMIGISRSQLYKMIKEGSFLAPVRVGTRILFPESEVNKWIQAQIEGRVQ